MDTRQTNCQNLVAELRPGVLSLSEKIIRQFQSKNSASLSANIESLAAIFANDDSTSPLLFITPEASLYTANILMKVGRSFDTFHTWYAITDTLTDQEYSGEIITDQSRAYHALLSGNSRIVLSQKILSSAPPSQSVYKRRELQFTNGEQQVLTKIIEALIQRGYTRYRGNVEPGGIRVRGEAIDIKHPLWDYTIAITVAGSTIERITKQSDQRTQDISRITIPPVSFPRETTDWQTVAKNTTLFCPSIVNLTGKQTIIIDSATPDIELPLREQAAAKELARCLVPPEQTNIDRPLTYEQAFEIIGSLAVGKPAVHADHGIGTFEGLQHRAIDSIEKEYLVLRYAEGDALSVPIEYAHKITPYVSEKNPTIHRLHGTAWAKARKAAKADAIEFAKELLSVAGRREDAARTPYFLSPEVEAELDKTFPHEMTDDQVRTWQEVRHDLIQDVPMDRLVVGDVGFGKTEIAYRTARHAIANGKQVAILAPTTLLVQQHFDVFSQRLPKTAGTVRLLSRFTSNKEQKLTKETITSGEAGIVVGTHALFSPSISWKNLGLVVIDEEQRFGVKQKEQLKKLRANVDVLSLSATPIPRTLSMALSGLRSLSLITTAPAGRKPVETFVGKLTEARLREAIERELKRGGQVYVVAPKIRQLAAIRRQIESLFPNVPTEIAHGRIDDSQLAQIIHRFDAGEIKILISSSIVEHGLDLPSANTMIVFYAPNFGLSELYQLRGRIGRRAAQGYALFFYTQGELSPIQRDRLTALTEASRLGSGWELARRDLEIRGAGNLLGAEQSGSVSAVGVQLYLDMVRQAATGDTTQRERADITLPFTAILPASYIANTDERTSWYVRLTRAQTPIELEKRAEDMQKKFGEFPPETENLLLSLQLQLAASGAGIQKIHTEKISPPDENPYDRIIVTTTNAPEVLRKLSHLKNPDGRPSNWHARGASLTWDVDKVTAGLIQKIVGLL